MMEAEGLPAQIHGAKILIVDDDEFFRTLIERLLSSAGYLNIFSTGDPERVVQLHCDKRFDLILLDIHMPKLSGLDVLEQLNALDPALHVPVIVLTGDEDVATRVDALERGARDFLNKPPLKREALSRIHNVLEAQILYKQNAFERGRYRDLLANMLPSSIIERLDAGETNIADEFGKVAVIFCDLVGFSDACTRIDPRIVVADLNTIFSALDQLAADYKIEKIKTIGDAYLAVSGFDPAVTKPFHLMADFALAAMDALRSLQEKLAIPFRMRVGIACGPLVAGVLSGPRSGLDIWGDVVNEASRLQSGSLADRINISERFAAEVEDSYDIETRGEMNLRGIGQVKAFFLNARRP